MDPLQNWTYAMHFFEHWLGALGEAMLLLVVTAGMWLIDLEAELKAIATLLIVVALALKVYAGFWDARRARKLEARVGEIERIAKEAEPHIKAMWQ